MYFEHDLRRAFTAHVKNNLQHLNHEFHRGVIIVEQNHLVQLGGLGFAALQQRCIFSFGRHRCAYYRSVVASNIVD